MKRSSQLLSVAMVALSMSCAVAESTTKDLTVTVDRFSTPESVYFDAESGETFVSNIAGDGAAKDGIGWISTMELDKSGHAVVKTIVEGLNAPKGLRARNGILWAADIDTMIKIDIKSHEVLARIPVPGSTFLNDVAIGPDGAVYVSDMIQSRIYVLRGDKPELFAAGEDLESPNGLLFVGDKLYVASWGFITDPSTFGTKAPGHVYYLDLETKAKTLVTKSPLGNLDGIEQAANGDLLLSDYLAGKVYRVNAQGEATLLFEGLKNSADIGLKGSVLLVPESSANRVSVFPL